MSCKMAVSRSQLEKDLPLPFVIYSAVSENTNASNSTSPQKDFITNNAMRISETDFCGAALKTDEVTTSETPASFKSPLISISNLPKTHERHAESHNLDMNKKSQMSPDSYGHLRYQKWQQSDVGDIRHHLLVQRTFTNHDDHHEPRTSSPLRKIRICTVASGIQTVTVSPTSGTLLYNSKNSDGREENSYQCQQHPNLLSPFVPSPNENAMSAEEIQEIFKTPNRNQQCSNEAGIEVCPSHPLTPSLLSPIGTPSYVFTPGRQFFNPFEIDHDRMQMPIFSPNMFNVNGSVNKSVKKEKESFWSVEHAALIMPADIKEAEIRLQHRYQQRVDREQDDRLQSAINKFFSNEHIVPSPWSEKIQHVLPCTPGTAKSVSSQTVMSVPPHVDLFAKLGGKYLLPDYKTEPSPSTDSFGCSFIRRKLLNQLNGNDSEMFESPSLPARATDEVIDSPSPIRLTTPEWERNTPNKVGFGHFSSSPICQVPDRTRHHVAESDLLTSPELSPIAGRAFKSVRSSGIFYSHQMEGTPRTVMQLDFSSILDDPDDVNDKSGTLMHKEAAEQHTDSITRSEAVSASDNCQFLASNLFHDSDGNSNTSNLCTDCVHRSVLASAESTSDTAVTVPQSQSSQDTGYQTASLQTTNHESASNQTSQDVVPSNTCDTDLHSFPVTFGTDLFTDLRQLKGHAFNSNTPENVTELKCKSNKSLDADGSFQGFAYESLKEKSSSADDVALFRTKSEACRVRKVRTISDMRHLKEKSSVSRDLIQSFNEEHGKPDSNNIKRSSWLGLNSHNSVPVASKIIRQGNPARHMFCETPPLCNDFPTAILKRPDDNDIVHDVPNEFDVSMQNASSFFSSSLENMVLHISNDINIPEKVNVSYEHTSGREQHAKLSFEDDRSLKEARLLLGRSEEIQKKCFHLKALESDSLYQALSGCVENENPLTAQCLLPLKGANRRSQTPPFRLKPVDCSTPTSRVLDSAEKNIDQVEGSRLGSEIAAEILKRAGDDLARVTNLLGYDTK